MVMKLKDIRIALISFILSLFLGLDLIHASPDSFIIDVKIKDEKTTVNDLQKQFFRDEKLSELSSGKSQFNIYQEANNRLIQDENLATGDDLKLEIDRDVLDGEKVRSYMLSRLQEKRFDAYRAKLAIGIQNSFEYIDLTSDNFEAEGEKGPYVLSVEYRSEAYRYSGELGRSFFVKGEKFNDFYFKGDYEFWRSEGKVIHQLKVGYQYIDRVMFNGDTDIVDNSDYQFTGHFIGADYELRNIALINFLRDMALEFNAHYLVSGNLAGDIDGTQGSMSGYYLGGSLESKILDNLLLKVIVGSFLLSGQSNITAMQYSFGINYLFDL